MDSEAMRLELPVEFSPLRMMDSTWSHCLEVTLALDSETWEVPVLVRRQREEAVVDVGSCIWGI